MQIGPAFFGRPMARPAFRAVEPTGRPAERPAMSVAPSGGRRASSLSLPAGGGAPDPLVREIAQLQALAAELETLAEALVRLAATTAGPVWPGPVPPVLPVAPPPSPVAPLPASPVAPLPVPPIAPPPVPVALPPAPPAPPAPLVPPPPAGDPAYQGVFTPFEVVPGVSVPTHLGAHWGPLTSYDDPARINTVLDTMQRAGIGYATVIVDTSRPEAQAAVLEAMRQHGIEPVVRLLPGGDWGKPLSAYTERDIQAWTAAAANLAAHGVKLVQLDNEPNLLLPNADDATIKRYADVAARLIQGAPGLALGLPPMSFTGDRTPERAAEERFYKGVLGNLAAKGPGLFERVFLATHPYDPGGYGAKENQRYRDWARQATGRDFNTLATEGGTPRRGAAAASWNLAKDSLADIAAHPQDTQSLWLIADGYLAGKPDTGWEADALVRADGSVDPLLKQLQQVRG